MGRRSKKSEVSVIHEYRPYVLWRRVSTKEQGKSELGLDAQLTIARTFMGREPAAMFTDVHSGTKLKQCEGLWKAVDVCHEKGYVLVIAKSDRCRNVQEALEILDAVGERNLIFCDLQTCDRFILTVMWAMWERQAIMGRINTKLALAERKKQIAENGGFFSKAGNWCDHLGARKGEDKAQGRHSGEGTRRLAKEWREESPLYLWVEMQVANRRPRKDILREAADLYSKNPDKWGTPQGACLSKGVLSRWITEMRGPLAQTK